MKRMGNHSINITYKHSKGDIVSRELPPDTWTAGKHDVGNQEGNVGENVEPQVSMDPDL